MNWRSGSIDGVILRGLSRHDDQRGWLLEGWRDDWRVASPKIVYVSSTNEGVARGPHEHREQTDCFSFLGRFMVRLWDNRPESRTCGNVMTFSAERTVVVVPPGVVHAYASLGKDQLVLNMPDRLYRGAGCTGPVDEIRHEQDPDSPFRVDDMRV
jgi:dTDP-4-dehydrorhamnose 3,5-epimerase